MPRKSLLSEIQAGPLLAVFPKIPKSPFFQTTLSTGTGLRLPDQEQNLTSFSSQCDAGQIRLNLLQALLV